MFTAERKQGFPIVIKSHERNSKLITYITHSTSKTNQPYIFKAFQIDNFLLIILQLLTYIWLYMLNWERMYPFKTLQKSHISPLNKTGETFIKSPKLWKSNLRKIRLPSGRKLELLIKFLNQSSSRGLWESFYLFFLNSALDRRSTSQIQLPLSEHFTIKASTFQTPVTCQPKGAVESVTMISVLLQFPGKPYLGLNLFLCHSNLGSKGYQHIWKRHTKHVTI